MTNIELYKQELELFLSTLSIFKGTSIINKDERLNAENRKFIKNKFIKIKSGNVDEATLDAAIDELLPYLYEKK